VPWRLMTRSDLREVHSISLQVHTANPEDPSVFVERLRLYRTGCLVLEPGDKVSGYVISHPWRFKVPSKLNAHLGQIPRDADTYYIHDIALPESARGQGAGTEAVERLADKARRAGLATLSLVAISDSTRFWRRQGFRAVVDAGLAATRASYGSASRYMVRDL